MTGSVLHGYEEHHIDRAEVYRFVRVERVMHWVNAVLFFALAGTGLVLLLRKELVLGEATLEILHQVHFYLGILFLFLPGLVFLLGDWRLFWLRIVDTFWWRPADLAWFMNLIVRWFQPQREPPDVGRFNAGQRLNMLTQLLGKWGLALSGFLMHVMPGHLLLFQVHVILFVILGLFVTGHIYLSLIHPSTRQSRHAIWSGLVQVEWVRRHHPGWLKKLSPSADDENPTHKADEEKSSAGKEGE